MAALIDNLLDTSFKTENSTGKNYATQNTNQITPSGAVNLIRVTMSDGTPAIRSTISEGASLVGSSTRLARLAPVDSTFQENADLIRVEPGRTYRATMSAVYYTTGANLAALGNWGYAIAPYFSDSAGAYHSNAGATYSTFPASTGPDWGEYSREFTVPEGASYVYLYLFLKYDGPALLSSNMHLFIRDLYFGTAGPAKGGVTEVSASTEARLGIVADVYSRSREKIQLELARVDSQLIAGERVELDAAAMTASPVVWHWRQITGPTVVLEPHEASLDFIAPDVDEDTTVRIAVYAASEDGRNRSDWHYFDLTIKPPMARFRASGSLEFEPVSPKYVGYDRGKREIWNDVIPPSGFSPNARHETEIIDLGILPDDVQFTTGGPPEVAAAGGIYVDLETGDIYRNFGAGYNETDDTTAAPRTNAWWVNPATGDILEWIED